MFNGMGNMGNMAGMMKKVQKLQNDMKKLQEELKTRTVEVSTGGGVIKLTMNGDKKVEKLLISKEVIDPNDVEMLQDLLSAAFNEGLVKAEEMVTSEMEKLTSSLGLPKGMI